MTARLYDVAAVIVTRGDVDLSPVLDSLLFGEVTVYNNATREDLGAYGRYAAIAETTRPLIFTIDDDCTITPQAQIGLLEAYEDGLMVSNMPPAWNGNAMPLLALPGWGAIFPRDAPAKAFARWDAAQLTEPLIDDFLRIGSDIVFPVLTESRMVDLGHENLPWAEDAGRTCKRADYQSKKRFYYERAAALR